MSGGVEVVIRVALIGIGATILLDLWNMALKRIFHVPSLQMRLLGRWVGYLPRGRFAHTNISETAPIKGEEALGWCAHYAIGVTFACLLIVTGGIDWVRQPTVLPALIVGLVTLIAPFCILQPGMGLGFAASKTPKPNVARLKSLASHLIYGVGLYLSGVGVRALLGP